LVADSDDISSRFTKRIAKVRRERIGNNGGLFAFKAEAGITEPRNFH
jgi:hypothetical protein